MGVISFVPTPSHAVFVSSFFNVLACSFVRFVSFVFFKSFLFRFCFGFNKRNENKVFFFQLYDSRFFSSPRVARAPSVPELRVI